MVMQILGLVFCACLLPIYSEISVREVNEAVCSNDACYTVSLNKKTFTGARKDCAKQKGNLVTIQNEEEAERIYNLLWKFTNTTNTTTFTLPLKLWIGLQLKPKSCVNRNQTLMGFSWITQTQHAKEGNFSNWATEPIVTCIKEKCVTMKLQMDSPDNYKWSDQPCSFHADGYICKFTFQGMCQQVVLAGPGYVEYDTPFRYKSSSLDLVPHGSLASVSCGHIGSHTGPWLICLQSNETNVHQWENSRPEKKSDGPFCASEELSCKYNNGGCEHECVDYPQNKSLSCRCKDGHVLASDLVSCVHPDHCQSNPCEQNCINLQYGFTCSCSRGFVLTENHINCTNIKGCLKGKCDPRTINDRKNKEMESELDTASSIQTGDGPHRTTVHPITYVENDKEDATKITQSTLMPSVGTVSSSAASVNDASDCMALIFGRSLLLSIFCIGGIF